MEIERKFLITRLPENLESYAKKELIQGYLSTEPVVRVRRSNDDYILTYKSKGFMSRIEEEMPLTKDSFEHLLKKCDGNVISKTRYLIPIENTELTIELDVFHGVFEGVRLAEIEFGSEDEANSFAPLDFFKEDVTFDGSFHNSHMTTLDANGIKELIERCK